MACLGRRIYLVVVIVVVVVFTLNRFFTQRHQHVFSSSLSQRYIINREVQILWSYSKSEKDQSRERIKISKSSANVPGTRAQQKRHPRNKNYEKILNKYNKGIPRWDNSEMGQDANDTKTKECDLRTTC